MEKFKIEVTEQDMEVIYRGLLELPAKYTLNLIQDLETQFRSQEKPKTKKDESGNKQEVQS